MKNQLPLNKTPNLICYGYESYNDSIATSDIYLNNILVEIDNFHTNENAVADNRFSFISKGIECCCENGLFKFVSSNNAALLKGILYEKACGDMDISFRVSRHLYTAPWAFVSVFVADSIDELEDDYIKSKASPYLFGYFRKSGLYKMIGDNIDSLNTTFNDCDSYWLRIIIRENQISSYYSDNGQDWIEAYCDTVDKGKEYYTGIYLDMNEFTYYNWLYSNHLQIYCYNILSENCVPIDYFYPTDYDGLSKSNPFVHEHKIPYHIIESFHIRLDELLCYCIDNGIYIDLPLNEKYIPNRIAYQKNDYSHYNMVYGYDSENDTVSILGYDKNLKLHASAESYDNILTGYLNNIGSDIVLHKFEMNYLPEQLNIDLIINTLTDYIECRDSSERYSGICQKRHRCVFGVAVYDCIVNSEKNFNTFLDDLRIAYFLTEHKKLMADRIRFLVEKNILKENSCELIEKGKKLYESTMLLLSLVMKCKLKPSANLMQDIKNKISTIKQNDIHLSTEILESLNQFKCTQTTISDQDQ